MLSHVTAAIPASAGIDKLVFALMNIKQITPVIPAPKTQMCLDLGVKPRFQIINGPIPIAITRSPIMGLKVASKKGGPTVIFVPVANSSASG